MRIYMPWNPTQLCANKFENFSYKLFLINHIYIYIYKQHQITHKVRYATKTQPNCEIQILDEKNHLG